MSAPYTVLLGTAEAIAGQPITGYPDVFVSPPTDFANAVTDSETLLGIAQGLFSDAASALAGGNYVEALGDDLAGSVYGFYFPAETLFLGGVEALGL